MLSSFLFDTQGNIPVRLFMYYLFNSRLQKNKKPDICSHFAGLFAKSLLTAAVSTRQVSVWSVDF